MYLEILFLLTIVVDLCCHMCVLLFIVEPVTVVQQIIQPVITDQGDGTQLVQHYLIAATDDNSSGLQTLSQEALQLLAQGQSVALSTPGMSPAFMPTQTNILDSTNILQQPNVAIVQVMHPLDMDSSGLQAVTPESASQMLTLDQLGSTIQLPSSLNLLGQPVIAQNASQLAAQIAEQSLPPSIETTPVITSMDNITVEPKDKQISSILVNDRPEQVGDILAVPGLASTITIVNSGDEIGVMKNGQFITLDTGTDADDDAMVNTAIDPSMMVSMPTIDDLPSSQIQGSTVSIIQTDTGNQMVILKREQSESIIQSLPQQ